MTRRALLSLVLLLLAALPVLAEVRPHPLFTEHLVLQQGMKVPVWGTAGPGEAVKVRLQGQEATTYAAADGTWKVVLEPLKAGGPFEMVIRGTNEIKLKDVLVGEVWICSGQSNMEWPMWMCNKPSEPASEEELKTLRLFQVPRQGSFDPQATVKASWKTSTPETLRTFSATAYFFGREIQKSTKVPVGLIQSAWGGTSAEAWTPGPALAAHPQLKYLWEKQRDRVEAYRKAEKKLLAEYDEKLAAWLKEQNAGEKKPGAEAAAVARPKKPPFEPPVDPSKGPHPSQLYGGMIHPLIPFAFRGVIWYQGESNASRAWEYRSLMPALIESWRAAWKQGEFPFLMVQLAPFERVGKGLWPELREAQAHTARTLPNVGLAIITDAGDRTDIHPKDKETVGKRLALLARKRVYGENVVASGPMYESVAFENGKAVVTFIEVGGGLVAKDGELKGFQICGKDQQFVKAKATVEGNRVIVEHPDVPEPVAVRFGWENYPEVNLFNKEGLPAAPFRTDDFEMITKPKGK